MEGDHLVEMLDNHRYHNGHKKCPVCKKDYVFRSDENTSLQIRLYGMYRHRKKGVVYYHNLEYNDL